MRSRTVTTNDDRLPLCSVFMMKAKAEAEAKEMQAKGMKRGEDFVDCEFCAFQFTTRRPLHEHGHLWYFTLPGRCVYFPLPPLGGF